MKKITLLLLLLLAAILATLAPAACSAPPPLKSDGHVKHMLDSAGDSVTLKSVGTTPVQNVQITFLSFYSFAQANTYEVDITIDGIERKETLLDSPHDIYGGLYVVGNGSLTDGVDVWYDPNLWEIADEGQ